MNLLSSDLNYSVNFIYSYSEINPEYEVISTVEMLIIFTSMFLFLIIMK